MRIGDFARLGNVSPRTLRFYGEAGLLRPAHVKPESGYRHYDPRQLAQLHQIQMFKEMGLSLGEIRTLLARRSTAAELREVLRERRSPLLKRIAGRLGGSRGSAGCALWRPGVETLPRPTVQLRQTRPVWVVSLREKIHRYEEAEVMFEEVERHVGPARVSGERAALWHSCANEGPAIDCEVLRFLREPVSLRGNLRTFQLPAVTVASVVNFGIDQNIKGSYRELAS